MKSKAALTKKDLIVVLACVVFLLANLAAIGPRGRRHAKQLLCLSNLYKWGTIFQAFAADNDGYFMRGWFQPFGDDYPRSSDYWMEALRPYYGNNHKLRCCSEATIPGTELGAWQYGGNGTFTGWGIFTDAWAPVVPGDYGSYGMNGWVCNPPPGDYYGPNNFWRTANVAGADNIPLFTDAQWIDGWPNHYDEPPAFDGMPWWEVSYDNSMPRYCINRHSGFVNSAFLDFSARKVGLKELWKLKWHRSFLVDGPWTIAGGVTPEHWPAWMQDFQDY